MFVKSKDAKEFAKTLGNPAVHLVETPPAEDRQPMMEWLKAESEIPSLAHHVVVRRCFHTAQQGASYEANPVEVTLLQQGGIVLADHDVCYFPAFKVARWVESNCVARQRKKHVMSGLASAATTFSQMTYDYSPGGH